jgi:DNA-binding GntR family transcriptional regulator
LESVRSLAAKLGVSLERLDWKVSLVQASPTLAETLDKNPGDTLIRCETIAALDGQVFSYMDGHIPNRLVDVDELRAFERGSLLDYLVEEGDLQLSYTCTEVFAIEADLHISSRLGVASASALLNLRETYFIDSGQPVVHYENYFITKIFNFHIYRRVLGSRSNK